MVALPGQLASQVIGGRAALAIAPLDTSQTSGCPSLRRWGGHWATEQRQKIPGFSGEVFWRKKGIFRSWRSARTVEMLQCSVSRAFRDYTRHSRAGGNPGQRP